MICMIAVLCFAGGLHYLARFFCVFVCGGSAMYSWPPAKLNTAAHQSIYRLSQWNRQQRIHHTYTRRETLLYAAATWKAWIPLPHEFVSAIGLIQSFLKPEERLATASLNFSPILDFQQLVVLFVRGESTSPVLQEHFTFPILIVRNIFSCPWKTLYTISVFYKVTRVIPHRACK